MEIAKDVVTSDGLTDAGKKNPDQAGAPGADLTDVEAAVWSTAFVNTLPDSAFLYVEDGGEKDDEGKTKPRTLRHFPYKDADAAIDLPHLRNSLARIPQAQFLTDQQKTELTAKAEKILADKNAKVKKSEITKRYVMPILKADTAGDQRLVTGEVLVPDTIDAQGHTISAAEIEQAAHSFLVGYNEATQIAYMHADFARPLALVESWIAPFDFDLNGAHVVKGTWIATVKVLDDVTWQAVKDGQIRGFSIGGTAFLEDLPAE